MSGYDDSRNDVGEVVWGKILAQLLVVDEIQMRQYGEDAYDVFLETLVLGYTSMRHHGWNPDEIHSLLDSVEESDNSLPVVDT